AHLGGTDPPFKLAKAQRPGRKYCFAFLLIKSKHELCGILGCGRDDRLRRRLKVAQASTVRRTSHTAFGKNRRDVTCWRNVERGMGGVHVGSNPEALQMRDFGRGALLDGD